MLGFCFPPAPESSPAGLLSHLDKRKHKAIHWGKHFIIDAHIIQAYKFGRQMFLIMIMIIIKNMISLSLAYILRGVKFCTPYIEHNI